RSPRGNARGTARPPWDQPARVVEGDLLDQVAREAGHRRLLQGKRPRLRGGCRRGDEAELLEHQEAVEHQVERAVLAVAEAEHLDVVHLDRTAGWRYVAHGAAEHPVVRSGECALLDGDVVDDVQAVDLHVRVWEGGEPAAVELDAGGLSLA